MNFDKIIKREGTNCIKYDSIEKRFGAKKQTKPLWVADMDFATPKFVLKGLEAVIENKILGYPYLDDGVFDSIIFWHKHRYSLNIKKDHIRIMPSVLSSLASVICALSEQNDEVIIQTPVYPPFFDIVSSNNRVLVENRLKKVKNRFEIDFEDLENKITKKTKLLILCSPHNPIGRVWGKKELKKLIEIAIRNGIIIISDEIHSDMVFKDFYSILSFKDSNRCAVVLNSPTKSFNMAGVKVSYIIAQDKQIKKSIDKEIKRRYIDELNGFACNAIKSAYSKKGLEYIDELNEYLQYNVEYTHRYLSLNLPKLQIVKNEATYLIWLDFKKFDMDHNQIKDKLLFESKVLLNDGMDFSKIQGEKCFRINVALPFKELREALKSIVKVFIPLG